MVFPPGAVEGEGASGMLDGALVGAGEEGEGVVVGATFFGGDVDGDGGAVAVEGEVGEEGGMRLVFVEGRALGRVEGCGVGTMGVWNLGNADAVGADEGGEALEGVGKLVGVFEASLEELVLGVKRKGGGEAEVEFDDGGRDGEGFEVGVESAVEDFGCERGFGKVEVSGMGGAVVEGEGEVEGSGGALVVAESIGEGLDEAFGDEEDRLMVFDGWFEAVMDLVGLRGAVEGEEAVVFLVKDIVEESGLGAESFG